MTPLMVILTMALGAMGEEAWGADALLGLEPQGTQGRVASAQGERGARSSGQWCLRRQGEKVIAG